MKVSVIIPAYNAEKTIGKTLEALLNQTYKDYEVIVVDDGSKDRTSEIMKKYMKKSKKIKLIKQKNAGPAAARNNGAKHSKGDVLIFTDSDCVPEKNFIEEMVKPIKGDVAGVQGRYKILNKEKIIARFVQYEIEERYERMKKFKYIDFIGTYAAAYRRDVFMKLGGFDTSFRKASGEDPEFSFRVESAGYKMVFNPKAIVYHPHPDTLKRYLKMKYGRGYWGRLLYKKHPEKKKGQSYNSMLYFLHIGLTGLLSLLFIVLLPFNYIYSLISLILLYITTIPSTIRISKFEKKFLLIAPFLIILRNLSIGFGILMGTLKIR
ncbi:MAG: glycosyltransferase [Candidatus Aenigmarchaeota archaeon]|nr:glycosyltransferase [Candidatus Aenigmarchaeota archaeon]